MPLLQPAWLMSDLLTQNAALVIAHPGHELRVHHWLELAKPQTFVLTDGSGRSTVSRLPSTTQILQRAQVTPGAVYGRFSDRQLYTALLEHNTELFLALAEELATAFLTHAIDYVVGDALEGYNPTHDVCRLLIDAAIAQANQRENRAIASFCFSLLDLPSAHHKQPVPFEQPASYEQPNTLAVLLQLDEAALARKLAAAKAYPELRQEVDTAIANVGLEAFQVEQLHPVINDGRILPLGAEPPFYERYGEQQVALGLYQDVIRYQQHFYPLAQVLHQFSMVSVAKT